MNLKGIFTISLDFELHWGGFEKWPLRGISNGSDNILIHGQLPASYLVTHPNDYRNYFLNTRMVIPEMVRLFEENEVHVTWATVGILFHRSAAELGDNIPEAKPTYKDINLSAYNYIKNVGIGKDEEHDPYHFAGSLIEKIISAPFQELASHTFSHFYCNEEGQTIEQFRQDLRAAQKIASTYGKRLTSLVFPRNQFNDQYLHTCFEEGITAVRSNPLDWFWHIESTLGESKWKRLNRGLDAYLPLGKKNTYDLSSIVKRDGYPVCLPASRLLRPYNPKEFILNTMKVARIKSEMERAARANEVYHLWWHPHNFGNFPQESLNALMEILEHYQHCKNRWRMQSLTMQETVSVIKK